MPRWAEPPEVYSSIDQRRLEALVCARDCRLLLCARDFE